MVLAIISMANANVNRDSLDSFALILVRRADMDVAVWENVTVQITQRYVFRCIYSFKNTFLLLCIEMFGGHFFVKKVYENQNVLIDSQVTKTKAADISEFTGRDNLFTFCSYWNIKKSVPFKIYSLIRCFSNILIRM